MLKTLEKILYVSIFVLCSKSYALEIENSESSTTSAINSNCKYPVKQSHSF